MPSVSATSSSTAAAISKSDMALTTQDFLKLMITELTNQDPFEPMSNQDIMAQMSTIQQLQSNQDMHSAFTGMIDKLDGFLNRQRISDASGLIGTVVSGETAAGLSTFGKVVSVSLADGAIMLALDNGTVVNFDKVTGLGDSSATDLVGQLVIGAAANGEYLVGKVGSVQVSPSGVILQLESGAQLDFDGAMPLNEESAAGLIGNFVIGTRNFLEVSGTVQGVSFAADETHLLLDDGSQLAVSAVQRVIRTNM